MIAQARRRAPRVPLIIVITAVLGVIAGIVPSTSSCATAAQCTPGGTDCPSGSVLCWGRGDLGQLGIGDGQNINRGDSVDELPFSLPRAALGEPIQAISAGGSHTCALTFNSDVYCWGHGLLGRLRYGS